MKNYKKIGLLVVIILFVTATMLMVSAQTLSNSAKMGGFHKTMFTSVIRNYNPSDDLAIKFDSALSVTGKEGDSPIFVVMDDKVGIGTNTPANTFDVVGTDMKIEGIMDLNNNRIINYPYPQSDVELATKKYFEDVNPWRKLEDNLYYSISDTNYEKVGIGTNNPEYTLDIDGVMRASRYRVGYSLGHSGTYSIKTSGGGSCSIRVTGGIVTSLNC